MIVTKREITIFPNTPQGRRMASEIISRLESHGEFKGSKIDSEQIVVYSEFQWPIKDEEVGNGND